VEYRRLGSSDLVVSEIALGSWLTLGGGIDAASARDIVDRSFALGINFIDTANVYNRGAAEELLGVQLASRPRDSYVLATKLYFPMSDDDKGLSRAQVEKQLDASLARLRTDYVDLYQCHRYDANTPLEETMEALSDAVRSGKVRYIGFSEWTPAQIRAALEIAGATKSVEKFVSSQPEYSLLYRAPEHGVIEVCAANGISQIVWSPLAQGVLTGKYRAGAAPSTGTRASSEKMGWAMSRYLSDDVLAAVDRLRPVADGLGVALSQLALAWVLREPNVASAIVGVSRPEQLDENAAVSRVKLDAATLAAIDDAVADVVAYQR
jgi:aryl-alcohol dehydrogenase-like predicted oxidoreductase